MFDLDRYKEVLIFAKNLKSNYISHFIYIF